MSSTAAPIIASAVAAALQSGYRPPLTSSQQPQAMMTPYYPGNTAPYDYPGYSYYMPPPPPPPQYQTATCCGVPDMCCLAILLGACFGWCCADELGPPPQF